MAATGLAKRRVAALLLGGLACLAPSVSPSAASSGGAPDVVSRLAPLVFLHSEERFLPIDADRFVTLSSLRWSHDDGCRDTSLAPRGEIVPASLGQADGRYSERRERPLWRACRRTGQRYSPADFTRPLDDGSATGGEGFFLDYAGPAEGDPAGAWPTIYEYVPGRFVAYWFFYARSQPVKVTSGLIRTVVGSKKLDTLGTHQGDWEHVTVRLDGDQPVEVAFYSHGSPRIVPWASVEQEAGHLVVYSARGSHASYPVSSRERGQLHCFGRVGCIVDPTDRGRAWQTWSLLRDVRTEPWYGFGGAWGTIGPWYRAEGVVGRRRETAGPLGPSRWKREVAPKAWQ